MGSSRATDARSFLTRYSAACPRSADPLHGRVAVVTGGGRGIGRAHSLLLAARGARVVVCDVGAELDGQGRDPSVADAVVAEIQAAGGDAVADHSDISTFEGAAQPVARAVDTFGQLDIVVNNAGLAGGGAAGSGAIEIDHRGAARARVRGELHRHDRDDPCRVAAPPRAGLGSHREHRLGGRARRPHPRRRRDRVRRGQGRGVVGDVVARAAGTRARDHGERGVAGHVHAHERSDVRGTRHHRPDSTSIPCTSPASSRGS